jgi:hypothetical protein
MKSWNALRRISLLFEHVQGFGGGAAGEVDRFGARAAERVFGSAQRRGTAAADAASSFFKHGSLRAEGPEETR